MQPVDDFHALLYHKSQVVNEFVWGSVFSEEEELIDISTQVVWVWVFLFFSFKPPLVIGMIKWLVYE